MSNLSQQTHASYLFELAYNEFHNGQYQQAADTFKKSLALYKHWQTFQGLGSALLNIQQYQSAINALKQSLDLYKHWQTFQYLGWHY